jgi:fructose-bisphosphate aldolase, class II
MEVSDRFTIAAAFGNVHGVYKPGNVKLTPTILRDSQQYMAGEVHHRTESGRLRVPRRLGLDGGRDREAISYGVVKMNIDTDLQWAFWDGIRRYEPTTTTTCRANSATRPAPTRRTRSSTTRGRGCEPPR